MQKKNDVFVIFFLRPITAASSRGASGVDDGGGSSMMMWMIFASEGFLLFWRS